MKTLYRGVGFSGSSSNTKKPDDFLFYCDPKENFTIRDVGTYRNTDTYPITALRPPVINQLWDDLAAAHPTYITKTNLGKDASGVYDIDRYVISSPTPKDNNNTPIPARKIRVMLETTHAELANIGHILEFAKMLFEQDDIPMIKALKETCEFSIIPVSNPWGLANIKRQNSNGVDINRNFTQGWKPSTGVPFSHDYSGTAPLSEVEAQIVEAEMIRFQPEIHISFHSHGDMGADGIYFWSVPAPDPQASSMSWRGHMRACMAGKQKWPSIRPPEELMDLRTYSKTGGSGRSCDAAYSVGALSVIIEAALTLDVDGSEGVKGSAPAMTLGVMGGLFCILEAIERVMHY